MGLHLLLLYEVIGYQLLVIRVQLFGFGKKWVPLLAPASLFPKFQNILFKISFNTRPTRVPSRLKFVFWYFCVLVF